MNKRSQAAASLLSVILSFLASSHHWLHMGILFLLGGSTNMMANMTQVLWIRRFMIVMTLVTVLFTVYRLYKHRCKERWVIGSTVISATLSFGFVYYTLNQFGW